MSGPLRTAAVLALTLVLGGLGAVLRALVVGRSPRAGLHAVNLVGTVLLVAATAAASRGMVAPWVAFVVGIGLAGALTTYSGWMALITERAEAVGWTRAVAVDAAAPVVLAVGLTVAVFAGT